MYSINELKNLGIQLKGEDNIQISKYVNIYNPQNLILHSNIRIDAFTILSCKGKIEIYDYVKISSHCLITSENNIIIEKYCNISSGVKIYGGINNNNIPITNPLIANKYSNLEDGDITIKKHSIIGANSIIYPNIYLAEGITIKPLSLVNKDTEPWKIYGGNPINFIENKTINNKIINDIDNEVFFDELYKDEINYIKNNKNVILEKKKILFKDEENNTYNENNTNNKIISEKQNILITGGSKGIGRNLALNFLKEGYNVIITYNKSNNEALELKEKGIFIYQLDITDYEKCKIILKEITNTFRKIDILINNAGMIKNSLFHKMSYDSWFDVINTNLISLYNITHPIINNMIENKKGKIINISSISGLKGSKGQSNYCSSKFGVIGFTKTLALEYGRHNIQTNCICPGLVNTDMIKEIDNKVLDKILESIPVNKLIESDEIFEICKLLINSNNANGSIFNMDGGMNC